MINNLFIDNMQFYLKINVVLFEQIVFLVYISLLGVVKDIKIYFNKEGVFGFKVIENFLLLNLLNIVVKEFVFLVFVNVINV